MIFKQADQVTGRKQPPKSQTRRPDFPYELAVQLWKHGWSYPRSPFQHWDESKQRWSAPPWKEWLSANPVTKADVAEANRILENNTITLPVLPKRGQKSVGRIHAQKIRQERLNEISEEDAKAEGAAIERMYELDYIPGWQSLGDDRYFTEDQRVSGVRGAFASIWDSIYPKEHNWLDNPDVWVLEFQNEGSEP